MQQNGTKRELFIGATVQPIQNCQLLASTNQISLFISKRSLIVMNLVLKTMKSCLIQDQKILSAIYYENLQIFIINTDKCLLVVNHEAQIINRQRIPQLLQAKSLILLNMEDGYKGVPFQRSDMLLYFTNQYMFQRSLLKSKCLCEIDIKFVTKPAISHFQWTAHFTLLEKINLLICWNQTQTYVFGTPSKLNQKLSILFVFDKIMKRNKMYQTDNKINAFQASLKHRVLIAAFMMGTIKIYKLDQTKKYVCQLRGHQRQCTGLFIPQQNPDLLYSCGLDNCIRIWDLRDFGQVYHVRFDVICAKVSMLSQKLIFAKSLESRRSFFVKFNLQLLKPILSQPKSGRLVHLISDGQWGVSLYSNNFIQTFLLGDYNNQTRQFNEKIQFPMKYGFLRAAVKIKPQTFAICIQKGFSIIKLNKKQTQNENFQLKRLVYNHSLQAKPNEKGKLMQIIHEKLLDTYFFTILQDWKNIPIAINVTAVSFLLNTVVPKWDIDINAKSVQKPEDYVILGNDRGYIFFVDTKKRTHYHSRVNFHTNPIISVQKIKPKGSTRLSFISMTNTQQIAIWFMSEQSCPQIYSRVTYTKDIAIIKPVQSFLAFGCKSGQFNIMQINCNVNSQIQFLQCAINRDEGHLKSIVAIDYLKYRNHSIWLTGGQDYAIKIWRGIEKQLLLQIRIFAHINCVTFVQRGLDILVSQAENQQVSVLSQHHIHQLAQCKSELQKQEYQPSKQTSIISIKEFLCPSKQLTSPTSPKKRQKNNESQDKSNSLHSSKKQQLKDFLRSKSGEKDIQLSLLPITSRKNQNKSDLHKSKLFSPAKQTNAAKESVTLPRIGTKKVSIYSDKKRYQLDDYLANNSDFVQKMENQKINYYSHAGKLNL